MKFNGPKIFVTYVIAFLATIFFILTAGWTGFFIVIPCFSLFLNHFLNQNLKFIYNQQYPIYKKGFYSMLGCSSTIERKNKYGF